MSYRSIRILFYHTIRNTESRFDTSLFTFLISFFNCSLALTNSSCIGLSTYSFFFNFRLIFFIRLLVILNIEAILLQLSFLEVLVVEFILVVDVFDFLESVHVELPDKWVEVAVPEVLGQNLLAKRLLVFDGERLAALREADYSKVIGLLWNSMNNIPQLAGFCSGSARTSGYPREPFSAKLAFWWPEKVETSFLATTNAYTQKNSDYFSRIFFRIKIKI